MLAMAIPYSAGAGQGWSPAVAVLIRIVTQ